MAGLISYCWAHPPQPYSTIKYPMVSLQKYRCVFLEIWNGNASMACPRDSSGESTMASSRDVPGPVQPAVRDPSGFTMWGSEFGAHGVAGVTLVNWSCRGSLSELQKLVGEQPHNDTVL